MKGVNLSATASCRQSCGLHSPRLLLRPFHKLTLTILRASQVSITCDVECNQATKISGHATWHGAGLAGLSMVVAAGPFSTSADVDYEPLKELLEYCRCAKPDTQPLHIILTGRLT